MLKFVVLGMELDDSGEIFFYAYCRAKILDVIFVDLFLELGQLTLLEDICKLWSVLTNRLSANDYFCSQVSHPFLSCKRLTGCSCLSFC